MTTYNVYFTNPRRRSGPTLVHRCADLDTAHDAALATHSRYRDLHPNCPGAYYYVEHGGAIVFSTQTRHERR